MSTDRDAASPKTPPTEPRPTRRRRRIDPEALVHDIYECALHADGWDQTLTQIRHYLNASAINLIGLEVASHDNPFLLTSNIPVDYGKDYQRHWYHEDPWVLGARGKRLNRGGETLTGGMLADRRELKRSAFFHDWLAGQDIQDVLCTNLWGPEPHWGQDPDHPRIVLCFMRGLKAEVFEEADRRKLQALAGHLNQAFRIALQLDQVQRDSALRQNALDQLAQPVFILGEHLQMISANAAGQRLLTSPDNPLRIRADRVTALGQRCEPGLDAARARAATGLPVRIAYRAERLGPARPARLIPLNDTTARELGINPKAGFVLYLRPSPEPRETLSAFCRLFGITPAEEVVLGALLENPDPQTVAARVGASIHTVRKQLESLRHKTGAKNLDQLLNRVFAIVG
jgi:DNA-binding CsgD family transcriptional regulator